MLPCQGRCREFDPRLPLHKKRLRPLFLLENFNKINCEKTILKLKINLNIKILYKTSCKKSFDNVRKIAHILKDKA